MRDIDILLGLKPRDAIIRMINDENGTRLPFEAFVVSAPTPLVGRQTKVTVSAIPSSSDEQDNPYSGSIDFTYNRLDLADQFDGILSNFRPPMPTSTQVLLDELTRLTGILFELDDIVLEDIVTSNAAPYRIKAKAESLRWVGYVDVTVLDVLDLQSYLETMLPSNTPRLGTLDESPTLTGQMINAPLVNITPYREEISQLYLNVPAQSNPLLQWLVKQAVPMPGSRIDQGYANWVCIPSPAPFNLYNAVVTTIVQGGGSVNPAAQDLDSYVEVVLDPAYCTNFQDPLMRLGFRDQSETTFSYHPRLTQVAVVSDTDATAYNLFYNSLKVGDVLKELTPYWQYLTTDGRAWVASDGAPGPTSLFNAVVQYNGQLRPQDLPPEKLDLNRVLVVTLAEDNTAYRGNLSIYYRAPIVLPAVLPTGYLDVPYSVSLSATGLNGPFTYLLVAGAFPTGHSINFNTGEVSGLAKETGAFKPVIEVTDANGTTVRYSYTYVIGIADIAIVGKAPPPQVGVPYSYEYSISGGVGPYTLDLDSGSLGSGLAVDRVNHRIVGVATTGGFKTFALRATDSRGLSSTINDAYEIVG